MFNGIVEAVGTIKSIQTNQECIDLSISNSGFDDLSIGASVAVNGACLTVTRFTADTFDVTVVPETLRLTNLAYLKAHDTVNLERAMKVNSRMSGHYVQGHVDGLGEIIDIQSEGSALLVKISLSSSLAHYLVKKGYVSIDGMSITLIDVGADWFTVTFIPQTQVLTMINRYHVGTKVNIEVDILSKYVEKLLGAKTLCNPI